MLHMRRVHDSGTEALITQQQNGWQIQINLREPNRNPTTVTGFLVPTVERAKHVANSEYLPWQRLRFSDSWVAG